jgi:hypothetical protein
MKLFHFPLSLSVSSLILSVSLSDTHSLLSAAVFQSMPYVQ